MPLPFRVAPPTRKIVRDVCQKRLVSERDVLNGGRTRNFVEARWHIWCLLRERGYSYKKIAMIFGMDHSTVIHGVRKLLEKYPDWNWSEELNEILSK